MLDGEAGEDLLMVVGARINLLCDQMMTMM